MYDREDEAFYQSYAPWENAGFDRMTAWEFKGTNFRTSAAGSTRNIVPDPCGICDPFLTPEVETNSATLRGAKDRNTVTVQQDMWPISATGKTRRTTIELTGAAGMTVPFGSPEKVSPTSATGRTRTTTIKLPGTVTAVWNPLR
jgi:hypothetical protein